jgi:hypothetical protein
MANKILLKGRGERREAAAAGTITPGHLIQYNTAGAFVVQTNDQKPCSPLVAVENDLVGDTISDNYVSGDYVQGEHLASGDEFLGLVAAGAAAIVRGDELASAGDGTIEKAVDAVNAIAVALEAIDNSAGGSAVRIKAMVL